MFRKLLRKPQSIQTIYLYLVLGNTLATSFIWGINTIFLLNAGLSNFQAFTANAFFMAGEVIFQIPTGILADMLGRRISYILGCLTLAVSTFLYLLIWKIHGPFWEWAIASMLLGLGYTFFSGALEAWLVDALHATNFKGHLENVFAKGQIIGGIAMLVGSVSGGIIAQLTNLGIPYILRSLVLILNFVTAFFLMKDLGFIKKQSKHPFTDMKIVLNNSIEQGLKNPQIKWLMLAAPFTSGVGFYIFYALQPFLLKLYGNEKAYGIAGIVAAIAAVSQIAGGFATPYIMRLFKRRTSLLFSGIFLTAVMLLLVSRVNSFWPAVVLIFLWGLIFAALSPVRMAYINHVVASKQRATILSFDALMGSSGGIFVQPILGKVADVWGYAPSYAVSAIFQVMALPFVLMARRQKAKADFKES